MVEAMAGEWMATMDILDREELQDIVREVDCRQQDRW
jgi:BMFP domain-containing protein YqiC